MAGMMGPPPGFAELMNRKYDILQQHADAATLAAQAAMAGAQGASTRDVASAGLLGAQAGQVAPTSQAARTLDYANAGEAGARGAYYGALGRVAERDNRPVLPDEGAALEAEHASRTLGVPVAPVAPTYTGAQPVTVPPPRQDPLAGVGGAELGAGVQPQNFGRPAIGAGSAGSGGTFGYPAIGAGTPPQHYADGTSNVQPNFGAWGAPSPYQLTPPPAPRAGYYNGAPVPTGATAMPAGPAAGPGGSENPTGRGPWGEQTPLGHWSVTGGQGTFSVGPSQPVVQSVDGGPQRALGTGRVVRDTYGQQIDQSLADPYSLRHNTGSVASAAAGGYVNPHPFGYADGTENVQPRHPGGTTGNVPRSDADYQVGQYGTKTWVNPALEPGDAGQRLRDASDALGNAHGYEAGTAKVPGKGSGMVDKVPAMLAPGEAVLNKGAAEHFGRDNIAALNAIGHAKMTVEAGAQAPAKPGEKAPPAKASGKPAGGPPAKEAPNAPAKGGKPASKPGAKTPGYAEGTSNVPDIRYQPPRPFPPIPTSGAKPQELSKGTHEVRPGKSASTPKIDPGALQALAGMLGGGGAMPAALGAGAPPPGKAGGMV